MVVQGVLSVVLGVLALAWPGVTLGALILLWGLFALLNGVGDVFCNHVRLALLCHRLAPFIVSR
jgi:uncharacterized membrane protein HdeD (DUF308 family)